MARVAAKAGVATKARAVTKARTTLGTRIDNVRETLLPRTNALGIVEYLAHSIQADTESEHK